MRVELRQRMGPPIAGKAGLIHYDLLIIPEDSEESARIDIFGQPGTTFIGEVRLADGYGEHYPLLQPTKIVGIGWEREVV